MLTPSMLAAILQNEQLEVFLI